MRLGRTNIEDKGSSLHTKIEKIGAENDIGVIIDNKRKIQAWKILENQDQKFNYKAKIDNITRSQSIQADILEP